MIKYIQQNISKRQAISEMSTDEHGHRITWRKLASLAFLFLIFSKAPSYAAEKKVYDLVVVGAGASGAAAAIHAGRSGLSVAVVEESPFVGGQIAGAAVSTMDDVGRTRFGIYGEFIDHVRSHYDSLGVATNICLWGDDTIAVEPSVARDILTDMLTSSASVDIYLRASVTRVLMDGDRITGVEAEQLGDYVKKKITFEADVFIDATEHGDLLPKAGASYRVGNSTSDALNFEANVQDITYAAVVKKYQGGLPDDLRMPGPPPGYEEHVKKFRGVVTVSGDRWPGAYPFDIPTHNAYRALPDPNNDYPIVGGDAETWPFITKTCVNWANDYPGHPGAQPGLSVSYIEDAEYRKKIERAAMNRTLAFIWYMQHELGMTDWSVDDGQGYGDWFSDGWETADDPLLPAEFAPILKHFPPFPYVREGRRIVGLETLAESDIKRDVRRARAYKNYSAGLALGEYPVDIHGSHLDRYMEHDLGETSESFPKTWAGNQGVFQVPFGVFIPEKIDGLIAAEKNISVSRMVNGAIRLQPIAMHTGQAAGAIAAEAVKSGVPPRDANVLSVQLALMDAGEWIAVDQCEDVASDGMYWQPVQWASLYEVLPKVKISKSQFGVTLPITSDELESVLKAAMPGHAIDISGIGDGKFLSKGEFLRALSDAGLKTEALGAFGADLLLSRGDAVRLCFEYKTQGSR
jgi:hypothetical protein